MKTITTVVGDEITIDDSNEACNKFGFNVGDMVSYRGEKGVVLGVGVPGPDTDCEHCSEFTKVLWFKFELDEGATFCCPFKLSDYKRI
ncbi:MAG TPA: hypothetical protein P5052_02085 [Candidatus Paceibacterota bacterium]|jgi:hypothetical protein|nr:hypothetical protein [Candidatus Paceibacterota bacterium]HRZ29541.1 hypothetical protein [Candidatus Paceibacterota bacterium]